MTISAITPGHQFPSQPDWPTSVQGAETKGEEPLASPLLKADFYYLTPSSPPPRVYSAAAAGGTTRREGEFAPYRMTVADGRTMNQRFSVDIQGFELHRQVTQVQDFTDGDEVRSVYYGEATRLLKLATGATGVRIFDHTVRLEDPVRRAAAGLREPVQSVHNDYTEKSGPQRVWDLLDEGEARYWLGHRFAIVNVWRSIGAPATRSPLGLIDARSTRRTDFVPTDLIYPDRVGEIYQVAHNPLHQWVYFPDLTRQEALLLKVFDSAEDGRAKMTGHSAFDNPSAPADAPSRESIELRALLSFAPSRA